MKRILITGGAGFIGHHFIEHLLKNTDWEIIVLDRLSYASSGYDRLRDINIFDEKRVKIFTADFTLPIEEGLEKELGQLDYIVHMGAETHVDNSISNPRKFFKVNLMGTVEMLEFARKQDHLKKFIFFSTDEVFGPASENINYKEGDRHNPGNPYSAAKAGAEDACVAYANTYRRPIMITNTMNVFGERQHPEKFIPMTVQKVLASETVRIHANKEKTEAGSRFWIHARNVSSALLFLLEKVDEFLDIKDTSKGKFNIVGEKEIDNLSLAKLIANILGKELKYEMVDFHSSRPGHDLRYALDGNKLEKLGWHHPKPLEVSLSKTIRWITAPENKRWFELKPFNKEG
jgi:dTDP-glucose 4,6-dehydratase